MLWRKLLDLTERKLDFFFKWNEQRNLIHFIPTCISNEKTMLFSPQSPTSKSDMEILQTDLDLRKLVARLKYV